MHEKKIYICKVCKQTSKSKYYHKKHMQIIHAEKNTLHEILHQFNECDYETILYVEFCGIYK